MQISLNEGYKMDILLLGYNSRFSCETCSELN